MSEPHPEPPFGATHEPESVLSATRGLCARCGELCDAQIAERDGGIWLVKWCPAHGRSEALVCSDAGWYRRSLAYLKPATEPLARSVAPFSGCPSSCGLCAHHEQHTCVPILELTDRCDLDCPICLVGKRDDRHLATGEVRAILERLVTLEGRINMLTLSGGEPTTHPDLLAIVDAARRPEIGLVSLSTNGVRLAHDDALLRALCERDVIISLQLDGFAPDTHQALRGRAELGAMKRRVVERVLAQGGRLSLTMTLAPGVNEHELGELLTLLFTEERVVSLMIQPLARSARARSRGYPDDRRPLTAPDVVRLLAEASNGVLAPSDFTPLPCSHPSCFTLTYLLRTEREGLVPLLRILPPEIYLDSIQNQALFDTRPDSLARIRDALYDLWSSSGLVPQRDAVLGSVKQLLVELNALGRQASPQGLVELGVRHVKSIFIHQFMDRDTFDLSRAVKCCNHYPQPDGRLLPACIRNNLGCYRGRD
jgi:uncharacterized radical SAM superfamily Fe-S cluster-containing enzyme